MNAMRSRCVRTGGGFSLIEILVSISIISILLALTLPMLVGARSQARQASCLSHLSGLASTIGLYTQTYKDRYPYAAADQWLATTPPEDGPGGAVLDGKHFDKMELYWPAVVAGIAPWREFYATWVCAGSRRKAGEPWSRLENGSTTDGAGPSYVYSHSFRARPEVWVVGSAPVDYLLAPVVVADVSFPAQKVIFYDGEMAHLAPNGDRDVRPMLFVDGHAALQRVSKALMPGTNIFTHTSEALHDTAGGVRGKDY